jgi:hypothetical protein
VASFGIWFLRHAGALAEPTNVRFEAQGERIRSILFLGHCFLYDVWTWSREPFAGFLDLAGNSKLQIAKVSLSVSFVAASLLAFHYARALVGTF